jgi:hypothetical protein
VCGVYSIIISNEISEKLVVGNVVAGRLRYSSVSFARKTENVDAVTYFFFHLAGNTVNVIANQSYGTS